VELALGGLLSLLGGAPLDLRSLRPELRSILAIKFSADPGCLTRRSRRSKLLYPPLHFRLADGRREGLTADDATLGHGSLLIVYHFKAVQACRCLAL
jgi:hypothetical protein